MSTHINSQASSGAIVTGHEHPHVLLYAHHQNTNKCDKKRGLRVGHDSEALGA